MHSHLLLAHILSMAVQWQPPRLAVIFSDDMMTNDPSCVTPLWRGLSRFFMHREEHCEIALRQASDTTYTRIVCNSKGLYMLDNFDYRSWLGYMDMWECQISEDQYKLIKGLVRGQIERGETYRYLEQEFGHLCGISPRALLCCDNGAWFCASHVAYILQTFGILTSDLPCVGYAPWNIRNQITKKIGINPKYTFVNVSLRRSQLTGATSGRGIGNRVYIV